MLAFEAVISPALWLCGACDTLWDPNEARRVPFAAFRRRHRAHRGRRVACIRRARSVCIGRTRHRTSRTRPHFPRTYACKRGARVTLTPVNSAICGILILLIPFAIAGISLMNSGLGRSRNAAHSLMSTLTVAGIAAIVYFVCGFSWQGFSGQPAYAFSIGGKQWNWIGAGRLFMVGLDFEGAPGLAAGLGMVSAALAAVIPLGAGAERWRLAGAATSGAILAGWTYPVFAHWVWAGGWLAQLGLNYGLGAGFADAGGAGTIQVAGGLTGLAVCWILGPRRGKYSAERLPAAIPGHNSAFVLLGCFLAWIGWAGLDSSVAILFYGAAPSRIALIALNTMLAAGSALLATALVTRARFSRPDASLSANGWVAGLVATSASAAFMAPA